MNDSRSVRGAAAPTLDALEQTDAFIARHIGTSPEDQAAMLAALGYPSRAALMDAIVPAAIRRRQKLALPAAISESDALARLKAIAGRNRVLKSFIGQGYYGTHMPGVILRNVLENPAWYTAYTPYQPEISQGRLEALVNFQTMVCDLTGMAIANASMLDEATAAAEAMTLCHRVGRSGSARFFVADDVFPQTIDVVRTRAKPLGLDVVVGPAADAANAGAFAVLLQYPGGERRCPRLRGARRRRARGRRARGRRRRPARADAARRRPANGAPTSSSARRSASACRWATAARTPDTSRRATNSSARCRAASSASPSTRTAATRTGSRCRRASSTSAARRRRRTSAPRRCCSP